MNLMRKKQELNLVETVEINQIEVASDEELITVFGGRGNRVSKSPAQTYQPSWWSIKLPNGGTPK